MAKQVESDALDLVDRSLGLTGGGQQTTEFDDGILSQVVDVGPLIRRGRTLAAREGIFTAVLRNVHPGAGTLLSSQNPFDATVGAIDPYPVPVPNHFDLWLMNAFVSQLSGTGTLTAVLFLSYPVVSQGWGIDNSGVAVVSTPAARVAYWDSVVNQSGGVGLQNGRDPTARFGIRMYRGSLLEFSSTASALATFELSLLLGLFPVGFGQDVLA